MVFRKVLLDVRLLLFNILVPLCAAITAASHSSLTVSADIAIKSPTNNHASTNSITAAFYRTDSDLETNF